MRKLITTVLSAFLAFTLIACGKESIEKANLKLTTAVQAARKVTTAQHKNGSITPAQYKERLLAFRAYYVASDELGAKLAELGTITAENKAEVITLLDGVAVTVDSLIKTGNYGIKNPQSQADFSARLSVARTVLASLKVTLAAITKPVDVKGIKVEKIDTVLTDIRLEYDAVPAS